MLNLNICPEQKPMGECPDKACPTEIAASAETIMTSMTARQLFGGYQDGWLRIVQRIAGQETGVEIYTIGRGRDPLVFAAYRGEDGDYCSAYERGEWTRRLLETADEVVVEGISSPGAASKVLRGYGASDVWPTLTLATDRGAGLIPVGARLEFVDGRLQQVGSDWHPLAG